MHICVTQPQWVDTWMKLEMTFSNGCDYKKVSILFLFFILKFVLNFGPSPEVCFEEVRTGSWVNTWYWLQLTLSFNVEGGDVNLEVMLEGSATIEQCLVAMLTTAGIPGRGYHLCKTNWCGEAGPVLDDLQVTLLDCQLRDGEHLLLRPGELPPKVRRAWGSISCGLILKCFWLESFISLIILGELRNIFVFYQHFSGRGNLDLSLWKLRISIMAVDDLVMQGARSSAVLLLT